MNPILQYMALLMAALVLLIVAFSLTGNSKQQVTYISGSNAYLDGSASDIFIDGRNTGTAGFVFRPRAKGSVVRIWNASANNVELRNNNLDSGLNVVAIGNLLTGLLPAGSTVRCVNQDGLSQGTLGTGSWLCQQEKSFV